MKNGAEMQSVRFEAAIGRMSDTYESLGIGNGPTHAVQFYDDDDFLVACVGDFLAAGMSVGQPVVAVTTEAHRLGIIDHLSERGFDVKRAAQRGMLVLVDAEALLDSFMRDGRPNPELCRAAVGGVLGAYQTRIPRVRVRMFGEMVDLLCRAGNIEGALALEEMWNEFASSYSFSLLCGYSMRTFGRESHKGSVAAICDKHAHVIPTESYLEVELGSRMREIALLQQRAQALDSELSRRDEIESSLRVALSTAEARVRD